MILERQRALHQEADVLEEAAAALLLEKPRTHRDKIVLEHRVRAYLARIQQNARELLAAYADKSGARQAEIDAVTTADFTEFYRRVREIKDAARAGQLADLGGASDLLRADRAREEEAIENLFSGEEALGRYFDLHAAHDAYLGLRGVAPVSYMAYLGGFDRFRDVPADTKRAAEYRKYLQGLKRYLEDFFARSQPLYDLEEAQERIAGEFSTLWKERCVAEWQPRDDDDPDEVAKLRKTFCVPCEKQFQDKPAYDSHLLGKKHKEAAAQLAERGVTAITPKLIAETMARKQREQEQKDRPLAYMEHIIGEYAQVLESVREDTKAHIERKQTLTDKERMEDDEIIDVDEEQLKEEDDDNRIYNPLKLPLGFDGKPIPYWLYKLHGLGVEYECEICGNYVYMGRKAFDRHFQEWRHAYGMRCLGIQNSKHFQDITSIEDALALWEKIKAGQNQVKVTPDAVEEFEDGEGNVFNKKTYDDLKRQGLI